MLKLARQSARGALGLLGGGLPLGPPDRRRALERYREVAGDYDRRTSDGEPYRRRAVTSLSLAPGDVVLDVGCGTGLNFGDIRARIGAGGQLIGIDQSPDMLARAQARVARHGWDNVTLIDAPAEDADPSVQADAALLCATHDILRSPPALENILAHVRSGGRVVAGGPKWAPWWRPDGPSLDAYTWRLNRAYVSTFEGFDRPWSHLAELVFDLEVTELLFGAGYLAVGSRPPAPPPSEPPPPVIPLEEAMQPRPEGVDGPTTGGNAAAGDRGRSERPGGSRQVPLRLSCGATLALAMMVP